MVHVRTNHMMFKASINLVTLFQVKGLSCFSMPI